MNAEAAEYSPEGSGVLVSQDVLDKMSDLPKAVARLVAETIMQIPQERGVPIRLEVPGDPPGTQYYALPPRGGPGRVVIYRDALPGEDGLWLVTSLMSQDAYDKYARGLVDDALVQGIAAAVAAGSASASLVSPVVRPISSGAVARDKAGGDGRS